MPNSIKYNASTQSQALKKGNFWIGTGDVGKGPSSSTGYFDGVTPGSNQYVIYYNKSGSNRIYYCANGDLVYTITNRLKGQNFTTLESALAYIATQNDMLCTNINYPSIVTNGLVVNVDAAFVPSYPMSGVSMYNTTYSATTAELYNGISWADYGVGGAFLFDGIDDAITINYSFTDFSYIEEPFSLCVWANKTQTNPQTRVVQRGIGGGGGYWGFGFTNGTQISFFIGNNSGGATQFSTNNIISNNTWYYLVSTYDNNGNVKLYLNGVDVTGTPVTMIKLTPPAYPICYNLGLYNCTIGGYKEYYKGYIAQHSGYNRVLTPAEVLQNFNATKSRFGY